MSIESLEKEIKELDKEIKELEEKIQPLVDLKLRRKRLLKTEKSKMFIKLHGITKDSVQRCDDEDMPYLEHIDNFSKWLAKNSKNPWCCWNGSIYKSQEIIAGRMERHPLGRYEDIS